jgi:hypothetical protein
MPRLVKHIEGVIFDNFETTTFLVKSVEGSYGEEDYILLGGFEAFLQDFRKAPEVIDLVVPPTFGLKNNTDFVTIEISY